MQTAPKAPPLTASCLLAAVLTYGSFSWCHAAAPAGTDKTFSVLSNSTTTLTSADWGFSDSDTPPDTFSTVKLTTLPASGTLQVDGITASAGQIVFLAPSGPAGTNWTPQTSAGNRSWKAITSSADSSKLAAIGDDQVYTSTDFGVSWTVRESIRSWRSITSSADGSKLAAVVFGGQIYTSTDSGASWTPRESNRYWQSITSSADGSKLAAVAWSGSIYISSDSGASWTPRASSRTWYSIASSADGSKLAAGVQSGQIYTSTDFGVTWTPTALSRWWLAITSSADGSKLAAAAAGGQIYTSSDSGVNWTARSLSNNWSAITSSADGSVLAAAAANDQIYTSTDSGLTWVPQETARNWLSITSSADGDKLAAVVGGGRIYTSIGTTPAITYTAPGGTDSASFTFQVQDSAATDNLDLSPNTLTFSYAPPPPPIPPVGTDKTFAVLPSSSTTLIQADWGFSDSDSPPHKLSAVKLTTLPATGTLQVDGVNATAGQTISVLPGAAGTTWMAQGAAGSRAWQSITCSADGSKLAAVVYRGQIYTSADSGVTWTPRLSNRSWQSITSSADGTKLASVDYFGRIYTSTDSGESWTPRESSRNWRSITSSADGSKLAAVAEGSQIYISANSGATWTPQESSRDWQVITSTADGIKLAAIAGNQIYSSTDSGMTWTPRGPSREWISVSYSADGSMLAAIGDHQIYTSTDSGQSWTLRSSSSPWYFITASADGSKLAAIGGDRIYTSTDSGVSWTARTLGRNWKAITSSSDGSRLAAIVSDGQIYTSVGQASSLTYTAPASAGGTSFTFQVQDSAETNNLDLSPKTITLNYAPSIPPTGTDKGLSLISTSTIMLGQPDWGFSDGDSPPDHFSAIKLTTLPANGTLQVDGVNANAGQILSLHPSGPAGATWTAQASAGSRDWRSITSSADGSKLAAVPYYGQIYTSTDSGTTWTPRESYRNWQSITSSADGNKLAAVDFNGQIYTSIDSGVTWSPREVRNSWISITSSADGSKLAAAAVHDLIYTSTDSGLNWTPRESSRGWLSITSSADGSKLAAVVHGGQIYTSTDSGVSWTPQESNRDWLSITSSADGSKLAAVVNDGQIYTSDDSGVTWMARESTRFWYAIASSADGSRLAAVASSQIYTSSDSGVTWTPRESSRSWNTIASSADGSRLAAGVTYGGQIYTSVGAASTLTYTAPAGTGITSFTFQVQDSAATDNLDLSPNTMTFHYAALPATPPGGWQINPVTGLFDIDVQVQNTTASIINGFRLSVDLGSYASSHPSLVLANRSSPGSITPAYVDYDYPVGIGQTVTQRLSFSIAAGVMPNPFTPALSVSTLSPFTAGGPLPGGLSFSSAAIQPNSGGPFLLTWPSTAGRFYRIYYTHDFGTWFPCGLPVQATSSQSQWSDTGPPYTITLPGMARFYKVSEITAP